MKTQETKNWTKISSYGPTLNTASGYALLITGLVIIPTYFFVRGFLESSVAAVDREFIDAVGSIVLFMFLFILFSILSKTFGPNNGKITLYEEGFYYKEKKKKVISSWKDVTEVKLEKKIPNDRFNSFLGIFMNKNTHKVDPRLVATLYTKSGNTGGINGFIDGKYILPQEIQTSDLSLKKNELLNEHCANMLFCIARRAYRAKWTGDLSSKNKLGWDIGV